jgi:hypothetical protein
LRESVPSSLGILAGRLAAKIVEGDEESRRWGCGVERRGGPIHAANRRRTGRVDSCCASCVRAGSCPSGVRSSRTELCPDGRSCMPVREKSDVELAGELEAIARAAADRLRAQADGDAEREVELQRTVGEAAGSAIAAGLSLAATRMLSGSVSGGRVRSWARRCCDGWSARRGAGARPTASISRRWCGRGALAWRIGTSRPRQGWRTARCARSSRAPRQGRRSTPPRPRPRDGGS